ncbi:hypothetical protein IG631_15149 [Alternaria alternata]|jgi:hypothetical protein|nr:hypothetical protein IG631_15149 [Alternaria alternata]
MGVLSMLVLSWQSGGERRLECSCYGALESRRRFEGCRICCFACSVVRRCGGAMSNRRGEADEGLLEGLGRAVGTACQVPEPSMT